MSDLNKNLPPEEETAEIAPLSEDTTADEPHRDGPMAQGIQDIEAFASSDTRAVKAAAPRRHRHAVTLVAVFAAVALLLGGTWALVKFLPEQKEPAPSPTTPDTSVTVLDKTLNKDGSVNERPIKSIQIHSLLNDYTLALGEDNVWVMNDERDLPLNTAAINDLVSAFSSVTAEDTVLSPETDSSVSMEEFGFDKPSVTATVTYADNVTVLFEFASLAVGDRYYLRLDRGDTVYLTDGAIATTAMAKPETYVSLQVINAPSVNPEDENGTVIIKQLSLTGPVRDNVITTVRPKDPEDGAQFENTSYVITAPYLLATDSAVSTEVFAVTAVTANEAVALHPTDKQLAEYGLDAPHSIAHIQLSVFTTTTDESGEVSSSGFYNTQDHIVRLGKKTADGSAYYALVDVLDVIYLISADQVPWAEKTYHDFANQYLFLQKLTSLKSITCTVEGKEYRFEFTHTPEGETLDDELTVTLNGKKLRTHEFRVLYQVLVTLYRTGAAPAAPQGDPLLSVRVTSLDNNIADNVIDIYEYSGSVCIARTETGDTYKLTASRVLDAIQQIHNYINGDDVVNRF